MVSIKSNQKLNPMARVGTLRERTTKLNQSEGLGQEQYERKLIPVFHVDARDVPPAEALVNTLGKTKEQKVPRSSGSQTVSTDKIGRAARKLFGKGDERVENLLDTRNCSSRNPLHTTATDDDLAQPGTEDALLGNLIGFKDGVSVIDHPNASSIRCTRKVEGVV